MQRVGVQRDIPPFLLGQGVVPRRHHLLDSAIGDGREPLVRGLSARRGRITEIGGLHAGVGLHHRAVAAPIDAVTGRASRGEDLRAASQIGRGRRNTDVGAWLGGRRGRHRR
ncbi:MAG: hypothetical protein HND48_25435 [Chloroflexi bacterium]|nr:hypothetical protein [Chloroflexota bacterium]